MTLFDSIIRMDSPLGRLELRSLDGKVVGKHQGYPFFTIGQRSGIGAHGERVYVTEIDHRGNTVHIGRNSDLLRTGLRAGRVNLVSAGAAPPDGARQSSDQPGMLGRPWRSVF